MKALVVSLFAIETNTSVSISNYGIITGLLDLGYEVTVLMPTINNELSYFDDTYKLNNVKILRVKNENLASKVVEHSINSSKMEKKLINLMRFIYNKFQIFDKTKMLMKEANNIKLDEYYDVVMSTSDPKTSHIFLKKMIDRGLKYGKWIQHWGDPLSGDISKNNIYPEIIIKRIEKSILRNADKIIYVSPFTLDDQMKKHSELAEKMFFVPLPCIHKNNINTTNKNNKLKIVYLGDYNSSVRNILPLYNSCRKMKFADLTIAGNSNLKLKNLDNIHILPRVSQSMVKELENESDVIVAIGNKKGTQIPGKIYYAASSNKPIVFVADGDNSKNIIKYLDTFDRYICCTNDEKSILQCLSRINNNYVTYSEVPEILKAVNVAKNIIE